MLYLIPLFPLLGFLVNATLGRRLSKNVSGGIATAAIGFSFGLSVIAVWGLLGSTPVDGVRAVDETVYSWISSGRLHIPLAFRLDPLSSIMILVVSGIGTLIHLYSTAYMHDEVDGEFARYFSYLNLFAAFMLVLVLGASFPVMFIGWEGVGLCSYLLIGFWFTKQSAADAGKKAFVVNRIGDFGFILGMLAIFATFHTLDFQAVAAAVSNVPKETTFGLLTGITLLLFLGATGKSAQLPLYVWLPDAMEGPTPVSALIHAATMVTAGVYMIGRNAVLFGHAPITLEVVAIVGCATAFLAGTIGLVQNDIKRVLAYSTVSQLGYMFLAMGCGAYAAGIFHLFTHAFFKALLFLGSGAVIHALHGEQDIRKMGGLWKELPITAQTFIVGTLAIAGFPLLSGFFSKDEILWKAWESGHAILWLVAVVTAFLTATYMFRLFFLTFLGTRRSGAGHSALGTGHAHSPSPPASAGHGAAHLHDAPPAMAIALVVLALGSIVAGYIGIPKVIWSQGNQIEAFLEPSFEAHGFDVKSPQALAPTLSEADLARAQARAAGNAPAAEAGDSAAELGLMGVSTLAGLSGIGVAWFFWYRKPAAADEMAARFAGLHRVLLGKYFVDEFYDKTIVQPIKAVSAGLLWRAVDAALIDGTVNAVGLVVRGWSAVLRRLQTGSVRAYAMSLFLGVVVMLGYLLWK